MRMPWKHETTILAAIMTLIGTIASYAYRVLNGEKFSFKTLALEGLVSIFSGAMVLLAAKYYAWDPEIAGGIAGLAGWSGAELIKVIEKVLIKRAEGIANGN